MCPPARQVPRRRGFGRGRWSGLAKPGRARRCSAFRPDHAVAQPRPHARLRVPIGTTLDGAPLELDIKEPAENGMGPHGLCVGATGSGKSELLRTIALGMMARNSPEVLNLLLVDFKGGATFLDFARAPHVAAVITNLSDEAPLVARMRDALGGEMNRRQQLLRTAGCVSVAAYATCAPGRCPLDRPADLVHHRRRVLRNAEPASRFRRHVCRDRPARPVAGYAPAPGQSAARRGPAAWDWKPICRIGCA